MYETWVKSLIDILDEVAPVTLVRNRLEIPLGSVTGDNSVLIHSRLDLTDDDSPWCDLVVEQVEDRIEIGYMIHIPNLNKRTDEEIVANVKSVGGGAGTVMLLQPVGEVAQETYVIKGTLSAPLEHPTDNFNSATHDMAEALVRLMECGGYERNQSMETVDEATDDLVTWPQE
ncbi:hypothetical protein [Tumebacillus flagellatus]|uniref:Uncharacterized protein n=1 Tax=Tumebacillus flagellatus TaxID=1157490 RepID=A0A074MHK9_9BACL|nr:hypothetical protein [Tumebacillus flagellatus]KEO85147.1 hypothetical protein EL26_00905 [Tumebacillus flagellatus]